MADTVLYSILLFILFLYFVWKKRNPIGIFLVFIYFLISIFSIIGIQTSIIKDDGIRLWPYIFLIACYLIYFRPYVLKSAEFRVEKFKYSLTNNYKIFLYIYIACTLITLKCYIPPVIRLISSGAWLANRNVFYYSTMAYPNHNYFEYLVFNFCAHVQILALIIAFILLLDESNKRLGYVTIFLSGLCSVMTNLYTSSRGGIMQVAAIILTMYIFFYKSLPARRKTFISIAIIAGTLIILPVFLDITVSRFSSSSSNSIIYYLGHAPVTFNAEVTRINKLALGQFGIGKVLGHDFDIISIGGTWGTSFYTFVGWLYIDWGPIGCVIVGIIFSALMIKLIKKDEYRLSDVYIVLFGFETLLDGVFVIARIYYLNIIIAIALYVFLKLFGDGAQIALPRVTFKIRR